MDTINCNHKQLRVEDLGLYDCVFSAAALSLVCLVDLCLFIIIIRLSILEFGLADFEYIRQIYYLLIYIIF